MTSADKPDETCETPGPNPGTDPVDEEITRPTESAHGEPATVITAADASRATIPAASDATRATIPAGPDPSVATRLEDGRTNWPTEPLPLSVTQHEDDEALPASIGGIRIERLLGRGGMGSVYLGHHPHLDLPVAVKVLTAGVGEKDRFLEEARTAVRLEHPNVVRVYNAGEEGGRLFLAMEVIDGGDVGQLVKREGRLSWRRATEIIADAAAGLGAAHAMGVVHRDVKPANLMLTRDGAVKVADLGLAKRLDADIGLTQTDTLMGTPAYMAPEQIMDVRRAGPAADVYALGVSLWQLLTGEIPFRRETSTQVILAHLNDPVPDIRTCIPDLPPPLVALLACMLDKDPQRRPADGAQLARDLHAVLADPATATMATVAADLTAAAPVDGATVGPATAASASSPYRSRAVLWVGIVLGVALVVGVGMALRETGDQAAPDTPRDADALMAQDAWQTPPRAAFLLPGDLPPALVARAESALLATGLRLVDRTAVDAFMREQDMARGGRMDIAAAVAVGRGIGGHVAMVASTAGEEVALRCWAVETTEVTGSRVVAPAELDDAVRALTDQAIGILPLRARLSRAGPDLAVSAGRLHGVETGDVFRVYDADPAVGGRTVAKATVVGVAADEATVRIRGDLPSLPALVERVD